MSCEVYCEGCGDCIRCYGDDPCPRYDDGHHYWVEPEPEEEEE